MQNIPIISNKVKSEIDEDAQNLLNMKQKEVEEDIKDNEEAPRLQVEARKAEAKKKQISMKEITELALASLGKELTFQGRLQKEEVDREVKAEIKSTINVEAAKEKLTNLKKEDSKGEEESINMAQDVQNDNQVAALKDMIQKTILGIRKKQAEKVHQMQIIAKLESQHKRDNVDMIRIKTAVQAVKAAKAGDQENCNKDQPKEQIEDFCYKAFPGDAESIQDCMDPAEFCFKCCDVEFGSAHLNLRNKCYKNKCGPKFIGSWIPVDN